MKEDTIDKCYHCGESCEKNVITSDNKHFCCEGCKTVFDILDQNNLCNYYTINSFPGISVRNKNSSVFAYLDDELVKQRLISFTNGKISTVSFHLSQIHCSSCIWLLENLYKLNKGILKSQVNFHKKEIHISFLEAEISLREVAELLANIGYEPNINLQDMEGNKVGNPYKKYYLKLGLTFFCFANIMLLSFPEYFGMDAISDGYYRKFFAYINFLLSLPVLFISASEFFLSAYNGLKQRNLNMDFPIALGISVIFIRSSIEIFFLGEAGYMDTLACLVLFMLTGRMFQNKTYESISFDRNYKSYFPVGVTLIKDNEEINIPVSKLNIGDCVLVRNEELIPADAVLFKGTAHIDYSFVTGESVPVDKNLGEIIYAGGKQVGAAIELKVIKPVSQSYLTQLWNNETFNKTESPTIISMANRVSRYFTIVILFISIAVAVYWLQTDIQKAFNAFSAVLIITCPCALALSSPFALGNAIRILGKWNVFFKNGNVIEKLASITTVVFDKTGTITQAGKANIKFYGDELSEKEKVIISTITKQSSHPLSKKIWQHLNTFSNLEIDNYHEYPGKGISAFVDQRAIKIGAYGFVTDKITTPLNENLSAKVFVSIDRQIKGNYAIQSEYRFGLNSLLATLNNKYAVALLSGDNDAEQSFLKSLFPDGSLLRFNQHPADKLSFIKSLQKKNETVLMIGDGLNDAGALKQADVGIVISDNINNFSPACDVIMDSSRFSSLEQIIGYSKKCITIIKVSFLLSFLYNAIGLFFAIQGTLSPLIAAILMPLSSISVVLFTTFSTKISANRMLNA